MQDTETNPLTLMNFLRKSFGALYRFQIIENDKPKDKGHEEIFWAVCFSWELMEVGHRLCQEKLRVRPSSSGYGIADIRKIN